MIEAHSSTFFYHVYRVKIWKSKQMKKETFIFDTLSTILLAPVQKIQKRANAIHVEIPVRVYEGNASVEFIRINDFEVCEDRRH
jgi:hypothetical protein